MGYSSYLVLLKKQKHETSSWGLHEPTSVACQGPSACMSSLKHTKCNTHLVVIYRLSEHVLGLLPTSLMKIFNSLGLSMEPWETSLTARLQSGHWAINFRSSEMAIQEILHWSGIRFRQIECQDYFEVRVSWHLFCAWNVLDLFIYIWKSRPQDFIVLSVHSWSHCWDWNTHTLKENKIKLQLCVFYFFKYRNVTHWGLL